MSRTALRAPAPARRVAGAYLRLLFHGGTIAGLCLGGMQALLSLVASGPGYVAWMSGTPFSNLREFTVMMFFLPLLQWWGEGGRATLKTALPVGRTRHELIRVGCGTAWAAVTLAVPIALYAWLGRVFYPEGPHSPAGYPAWYPVALFTAGLTLYLLGAALLLTSERPGRVFVLVAVAAGALPKLLPSPDASREATNSGVWTEILVAHWSVQDLPQLSTPEWLAGVTLPLGLACALVFAAAHHDCRRARAWAGAVGRVEDALGGLLRREPPPGSVRPKAQPAGLRRPPSAVAIARRHFALLGRRMRWPMLIAMCFAWDAARTRAGAGGAAPAFPAFTAVHATVAACWPLLVWMDERDPFRDFDEALPVGPVKKRILHATAGAAWLLVGFLILVAGRVAGAAAAGAVASPLDVPVWLWLGVPCGALIHYFIGTIPTLLVHRPGPTVFLLSLATMLGDKVVRWSDPAALSPLRAIAPFLNDSGGVNHAAWWSFAATGCWLALSAAAAAWVLALRDPADGRRRFPTARAVVRSLGSWRGRIPGPRSTAGPGGEPGGRERAPGWIPHLP